MKRIHLLLIGLLLTSFSVIAQTTEDKAKVVQVCLDLPDIQNLFPTDGNGNSIAVYIMQYPLALPTDLSISKFGKNIVFMNRAEIYNNQTKTYFLFQTLDIAESKALAQFTLYYDQTSTEKKVMVVVLGLDKENNSWVVVKKEIKK